MPSGIRGQVVHGILWPAELQAPHRIQQFSVSPCSNYSKGWVHDCSTTGGNDKSGSGRAQMQQVQVWTANFYRGEKEPQEEPDARLHVLKIL